MILPKPSPQRERDRALRATLVANGSLRLRGDSDPITPYRGTLGPATLTLAGVRRHRNKAPGPLETFNESWAQLPWLSEAGEGEIDKQVFSL